MRRPADRTSRRGDLGAGTNPRAGRWPLVRRRTLNAALAAQESAHEREIRSAKLASAALLEDEKRRLSDILRDLRLVRVQVEAYRPQSDVIGFSVQMPGYIFDGFRSERRFHEVLAMMIERDMHATPEGRVAVGRWLTGA